MKFNELTIGHMTMKEIENFLYISTGNEKLKSNDKVLFLIFNLPCIVTCPFATEHCKGKCYAKKAEARFPKVKERRYRNLELSKSETFIPMIIRFIEIKLARLSEGRKIIFRIHESGDFYSAEYADKWIEIADHFKNDDRIRFVAYTKSHRFFTGKSHDINLNFSLWDDTADEDIELAKQMGMPIYTAVQKFTDAVVYGDERIDNYFRCRCADCGTCQACYHGKVKVIACEIH